MFGLASSSKKSFRLPQVRPSLLDTRMRGDPWVAACQPELLVVYLNNQPITLLPGSPLELASLNQILFTLRHRPPRKRKKNLS
jgi:hypothetical protein